MNLILLIIVFCYWTMAEGLLLDLVWHLSAHVELMQFAFAAQYGNVVHIIKATLLPDNMTDVAARLLLVNYLLNN